MALSNWCPRDIPSLWSHACNHKKLHCPSQCNASIVGHKGAGGLTITWGSDCRYWKCTTTQIGCHCVTCYELKNVCWLKVKGRYGIHCLTEGMHYEVKIVVKLLSCVCITGPLTCTLTDPKGCKHVCKKNCMEMPRNQIICITIGKFCVRKSSGCGEIKFCMSNTDSSTLEAWYCYHWCSYCAQILSPTAELLPSDNQHIHACIK